jgi:hypothetical protein
MHMKMDHLSFSSNGPHTKTTAFKSTLVDQVLSAQAAAAASNVRRSLINVASARTMAVFLERDDAVKILESFSRLEAYMMLECLSALVRQGQGEITLAARLGNDGEVYEAAQSTVNVAGQVRPLLRDGHLFIHFPNERLVVSAEPVGGRGDDSMWIGVRSSIDSAGFFKRWQEFTRQHNYLRGRSFFADGEIIERDNPCTWDSILLSQAAKRMIQTHVQGFLKNRPRLRDLGVKCRRGLILSGPPGTGKTLLGKVLSSILGTSFMWVLPRHIVNQKSFHEMLSIARNVAPTVLFLEDLDLFAEEREGNKSLGLGELMNQLDGAQDNEDIVTIATTNRLDVIEKALRNRPGRFDRVVEIGPMDELCRRDMLTRLLSRASLEANDMAHLVAATEGYTGAQIAEVANTVYILALDGNNGDENNADADVPVLVGRNLIDAAVDEVRIERTGRLGFHVA